MPAMASSSSPRLSGFAPVIDRRTRLLILGSFPGAASLSAGQYYAHPRNQFWRLLSGVLEDDLSAVPYERRLQRLLQHRTGLWDVIAACTREGSLDTAIRQAQPADFSALLASCPALTTVAFNGKTAGRYAPHFANAGLATVLLPSSSPAHAQLRFEEKLVQWRALKTSLI